MTAAIFAFTALAAALYAWGKWQKQAQAHQPAWVASWDQFQAGRAATAAAKGDYT